MTAGQCSSYRLLINRFLKSTFGPALLLSIDSRFPKRMPLTIYSLSVPRTLGGGDCVLIYKLLARRKGFSRSQVPILGIEDSRPVIKSRMLAGLRWFFLSHQACAPSRLFCCSFLAMGGKLITVQSRCRPLWGSLICPCVTTLPGSHALAFRVG